MRAVRMGGSAASKRNGRLLAAVAAVGLAGHCAAATTLTWDPNQSNGSSLGGSGTWNTNTTANWYTGSADTQWTDTTGVNTAVFNTSAGAVTIPVGGVAAGALTFAIGGYTIGGSSQGALTLGGSTPSITMSSGTGNTTIASSIAGLSSGTLTVIGVPSGAGTTTAGQLILTSASTFSGSWVAQSTSGNFGGDVLQLNDTTSTTANPVIAGNLQIGSANSSGNGVGVLAASANQFSSSSVVTFYSGGSSYQYLNIHANQTLAGLNGGGGNGVVQIGANTDGTNYGGVTLTLDGSGNYYFGGTIRNYDSGGNAGDVLSLVMSGPGTQTLSAVSYTGSTAINGGVLSLKSALTTTSGISFGGGTLQFNGNATDYSAKIVSSTSAISLDTDGQTVTFASALAASNTGGLTKLGVGNLTLSGANVYTGNTTVNAGTLLFSGTSSLPTSSKLSVATGAVVSLADGTARTSTVGGLTLAGGSTVALDWNGGSTDTLSTSAAATTSGNVGISINPSNSPSGSNLTVLSAASGLTSAHYFLANNSNYTATIGASDTAVQVSAYSSATALTNEYWYGGQVSGAANAMAFSNGSASNWSSGATYGATALVPGSSTNVIFSTTSGATQESNIVPGASMSVAGVTFNDTTAVTIANDGSTLTVGSGFITATQNATINAPVAFTSGSAGELAKAATAATLTLGSVNASASSTSAGSYIGDSTYNGNVSITGPLTYTGYRMVVSGGTLNYSGTGGSVTNNGAAFGVADGSPATMNMTGGSLSVYSNNSTYGQFFIGNDSTGVLNVSGGTLAWTGTAAGANANFEIGGDVHYGNSSGNGTLTVSGSGLVQIAGTGNITFGYGGATGVLNLNGGTLQTAMSFVKESGTGTINFNGGTLQASGNNSNWIQSVTSDVKSGGAIIDTQGYSVTIAQNLLTGGGTDGGLKKLGTGTLTLTGTSTYNGGTTISAGTIRANSSSASLGTGTVTIDSGGTLGGNGSVGNGTNALTVSAGATITAGQDANTAGKLTTGSESWVAGGKFLEKITNATAAAGTGYDQIAMGALTLSSLSSSTPFVVALSTLGDTPTNFSATGSDSWTIATFTSVTGGPTLTGSDTVLATAAPNTVAASSGMFALDTSGFTGTNSAPASSYFELDLLGNGGSGSLVLIYNGTPEPGTGLLVLAGIVPLLAGRRRRTLKNAGGGGGS